MAAPIAPLLSERGPEEVDSFVIRFAIVMIGFLLRITVN